MFRLSNRSTIRDVFCIINGSEFQPVCLQTLGWILDWGDIIFKRIHIKCYNQNIKSIEANKSKFWSVFCIGVYWKIKGIEPQDIIFLCVTRCLKDSSSTWNPVIFFLINKLGVSAADMTYSFCHQNLKHCCFANMYLYPFNKVKRPDLHLG